jgi:hypothetical protein
VTLERPTPARVKKYVQQFEQDNGVTERALTTLFETFPRNTQLEEVLLKVAALNGLYNTNIYAVHDVAEHIWKSDIDSGLEKHSLEVVEKIAKVEVGGRQRRNYSFATKYCRFHVPQAYPLYDWYVDAILWAYQRQDQFAQFQHKELWERYPRYVEILEQFRSHYGLAGLSWREIDKFLWLYGKEMESDADGGR